jgi:hypothetical protein
MRRDAMNAQTWPQPTGWKPRSARRAPPCGKPTPPTAQPYDVSKHYRDEVVPLRKVISEENVLRYNGMLIGVFELLADTRGSSEHGDCGDQCATGFLVGQCCLAGSLMMGNL